MSIITYVQLITTNIIQLLIKLMILLPLTTLSSTAFAEDIYIHVYIDQAKGINSSTTTGTEGDPFKSITYAMLKNRETTEPLFVHIKTGVYDANPNKLPNEREIFPIVIKNGMTIQGDDGAEYCIISGVYNSDSKAAIFRGENLTQIVIKGLTLRDMKRSDGNGGACEFHLCSGTIQDCSFINNRSNWDGGAFLLSIPTGLRFNVINNNFNNNVAVSGGGGFIIYGNFKGIIRDNNFNSNTAEKHQGGAFCTYSDTQSYFTGDITGNSFINNTAKGSGGGFWIQHDMIGIISGNIFRNNSVNVYSGGGFRVNSTFTGDIINNIFNGNTADDDGGAFYIKNQFKGNIINNSFIGNKTNYSGGGFSINSSFVGNITNNIFRQNSVVYHNGAGFYIHNDFIGNISNNSFNENTADDHGGGFFIGDNLIGDIYANIFSRNIAKNNAGGCFDVEKNMSGSIIRNTFSGNSAGYFCDQTFRILGILEGKIDKNLFSQKSSFYLGSDGNKPVIISNNFFIDRHITSRQNLHVFNNTFYASGIYINSSASNSIIKNNIFINYETAIWEEGELYLPITNNNFHGLTNILNRNNQAMGSDAFFIEMLLPNSFINNTDMSPGIVGEDLETGVWSENPIYDIENNITIFVDVNKDWEDDKWVGAMINLSNSTSYRQHYWIVGNTATQIKVRGHIYSTNIGQKDHIYSIDDFRLGPNSKNIDAGINTTILVDDFEEHLRPQGGYFDIGADEFFKGEMVPGICHVDPPAKDITSSSAMLQAQVNPNELTASCYFEYGNNTDYGKSTSEFKCYTGSGLFDVSSYIKELSPDTEYHFRLVAINSTGTSYGNDQSFKTLPITANIIGKISTAIAGHTGLEVKNAIVKLEGTEFETSTNAKGEFVFEKVPAMTYKLIIKADNLLPIEQPINPSEGQILDIGVKEMIVPSSDGIEHVIINAVNSERMRWDSIGDNKKGLPEAIDALQTLVEIK